MPTLTSARDVSWMQRLSQRETRRRLEVDLLPRFLMRQRWYGAKDAGSPAVALLRVVAFGRPDFAAALTLLRVVPPGQSEQTYFLPLALAQPPEGPAAAFAIGDIDRDGARVRLIDAVADDRFIRALLDAMRRGARTDELRFRRTSAFRDAQALEAAPIERLRAEQSNTSLRIGPAMLKVFRRVHAGVHPEIEITGHLTERTSFRHCATLLGAGEWAGDGTEPRVLCALQTAIPNRGDGWSVAVRRLERVAANREGDDRRALIALAARIGRRTAELHRALAQPSGDPAFAPEAVTPVHLAAWGASVAAQARSALNGLRLTRLEGSAGQLAAWLRGHESDLYDRIAALTRGVVQAQCARLHNDYHLGQILVSDDDVYIIDFEGEPLRPLGERRAKHSVLRDVAGMLRSFSYAAAAAARTLPLTQRAEAAARLDAVASGMSQAFLKSYRDAVGDCPGVPPQPQARRLLELFLLEKALYEINYELANRPDWVEIPLAGVAALLEGTSSDAGH